MLEPAQAPLALRAPAVGDLVSGKKRWFVWHVLSKEWRWLRTGSVLLSEQPFTTGKTQFMSAAAAPGHLCGGRGVWCCAAVLCRARWEVTDTCEPSLSPCCRGWSSSEGLQERRFGDLPLSSIATAIASHRSVPPLGSLVCIGAGAEPTSKTALWNRRSCRRNYFYLGSACSPNQLCAPLVLA